MDTRPSSAGTPILSNIATYNCIPNLSLLSSIGGLVVKLAVAIRDLPTSDDSASPGFDSRPMHDVRLQAIDFSFAFCLLLFLRHLSFG